MVTAVVVLVGGEENYLIAMVLRAGGAAKTEMKVILGSLLGMTAAGAPLVAGAVGAVTAAGAAAVAIVD